MHAGTSSPRSLSSKPPAKALLCVGAVTARAPIAPMAPMAPTVPMALIALISGAIVREINRYGES